MSFSIFSRIIALTSSITLLQIHDAKLLQRSNLCHSVCRLSQWQRHLICTEINSGVVNNLSTFTWLIRYFQTYDSPICSSNMISDWVTNCTLNGAFIWRGIWLHLVQCGPDLNVIYCVWQSQSVLECGIMGQTKPVIVLRNLCCKTVNPAMKKQRFADKNLSKMTLFYACNPICIFRNTVHLTI